MGMTWIRLRSRVEILYFKWTVGAFGKVPMAMGTSVVALQARNEMSRYWSGRKILVIEVLGQDRRRRFVDRVEECERKDSTRKGCCRRAAQGSVQQTRQKGVRLQ